MDHMVTINYTTSYILYHIPAIYSTILQPIKSLVNGCFFFPTRYTWQFHRFQPSPFSDRAACLAIQNLWVSHQKHQSDRWIYSDGCWFWMVLDIEFYIYIYTCHRYEIKQQNDLDETLWFSVCWHHQAVASVAHHLDTLRSGSYGFEKS